MTYLALVLSVLVSPANPITGSIGSSVEDRRFESQPKNTSRGQVNHRQKKKGRLLLVAAGIGLTVWFLRRKRDLGPTAESAFNKALVAFFGFVNRYIPW